MGELQRHPWVQSRLLGIPGRERHDHLGGRDQHSASGGLWKRDLGCDRVLPGYGPAAAAATSARRNRVTERRNRVARAMVRGRSELQDRKSTRLNSSHLVI